MGSVWLGIKFVLLILWRLMSGIVVMQRDAQND